MELRHLIYFEAVVRHGGFTRAAEALHVAQPSVSALIRQLEKALGVDLLLRTTRRVTLTPAGEQFLHRTRRILDELAAARQEMAAHATALTGRIRVGTTPVVGDLPLPELLVRFRRTHPGVDIELASGLVGDLLDRLAAAELDLVIGPEHGPDDRFTCRPVASERLVLITAPGDGRAVTALRQVVGDPFVCLPHGSGLHNLLVAAADHAGFTPEVAFTTHTPYSVRELVSAGMGVALVAESTATGPGHPVRVHRLRELPHHPHISAFVARGRPDPAAKALFTVAGGTNLPRPSDCQTRGRPLIPRHKLAL